MDLLPETREVSEGEGGRERAKKGRVLAGVNVRCQAEARRDEGKGEVEQGRKEGEKERRKQILLNRKGRAGRGCERIR